MINLVYFKALKEKNLFPVQPIPQIGVGVFVNSSHFSIQHRKSITIF